MPRILPRRAPFMRRFPSSRISGLCPKALSVLLVCSPALAADPAKNAAPSTKTEIIQVQAPPPVEPEQPAPRTTVAPTQAPTPVAPVAAPSVPPGPTLGSVGGTPADA